MKPIVFFFFSITFFFQRTEKKGSWHVMYIMHLIKFMVIFLSVRIKDTALSSVDTVKGKRLATKTHLDFFLLPPECSLLLP